MEKKWISKSGFKTKNAAFIAGQKAYGVRKVYICDTLLVALKNYKKKQEDFKKLYGKRYHYYHLEEVKLLTINMEK